MVYVGRSLGVAFLQRTSFLLPVMTTYPLHPEGVPLNEMQDKQSPWFHVLSTCL